MIKKNLKQVLVLLGLSYVFFILGNGIIGLTNPDEVFYAQIAKEMIQQKTWTTPYLFGAPQFEKPIFLYWSLRIGYIIFGVNSFAARFPPALFATLGVVAVYFLSLVGFNNQRKAFLSSLILMSSGLYIGLARTVFTDLIFSVLVLFSLVSFYWGYAQQHKKNAGILLFFVFSGLAVLAKGPLGFFIPLFTVAAFLLIKRNLRFLYSKYSLWGILIFISISFPWYIFMIKSYGSSFVHEFFYNDHWRRLIEAEHRGNDTWYFYLTAMIGCMAPWSLFVFFGLVNFFRQLKRQVNPIYVFLASWICVVFLIFEPAHSKLTSYIVPMFPALAIIAGDFIYENIYQKKASRLFLGIYLAMALMLILLPFGVIFALFKYPSYLSSNVAVYVFISVLSIFILAALFLILKRKLLKATYSFSFLLFLFLLLIPFIRKDIEPYFSSRQACEYLLKNYEVKNTILCSKMLVRGVRYYTDKETAVIDINGKNFFSPHPIPYLNENKKVFDFLQRQSVTYCLLRKSSVKAIERITDKKMKFTLLKIIGDEHIVKIEPLPSS